MKTINIYLTKNDKDKLNEMQSKYKVSISTIADKLVHLTYKYLNQTNKDYLDYLMNEYIDKSKCLKTCIRPKCYKEGNIYMNLIQNKNLFTTNVLIAWTRKEIKKHIDDKQYQKMSNELNNQLSKERENYWNYNNVVRNQARAIRENKDYYKRILNE